MRLHHHNFAQTLLSTQASRRSRTSFLPFYRLFLFSPATCIGRKTKSLSALSAALCLLFCYVTSSERAWMLLQHHDFVPSLSTCWKVKSRGNRPVTVQTLLRSLLCKETLNCAREHDYFCSAISLCFSRLRFALSVTQDYRSPVSALFAQHKNRTAYSLVWIYHWRRPSAWDSVSLGLWYSNFLLFGTAMCMQCCECCKWIFRLGECNVDKQNKTDADLTVVLTSSFMLRIWRTSLLDLLPTRTMFLTPATSSPSKCWSSWSL